MRYFVLYDSEEYELLLSCNGKWTRTSTIAIGDIVALRCMKNNIVISDIFYDDKTTKSLVFLKLAGKIYIVPRFIPYLPTTKTVLFSKNIENNHVEIAYDGVTHISIENRDYIYQYDMSGYVDINVEYNDGLFLFIGDSCENKHIIIVRCNLDYEELLNVEGNTIKIEEKSILVKSIFKDTLGRIRYDEYVFEDNSYKCINTRFEYTYNIHYDKIGYKILIEDAIYSHDYEYISHCMLDSVSCDDLSHYFLSILPSNIEILRVEPIDDIMYFLVRDIAEVYIKNIKLYMNKDGKISNIEEVTNV